MNLELHLRAVGALLLAIAAIHVMFPRWFRWKEELARLSLLNRQMFIVHCLFIVLVLVMMGVLSLQFPETLLEATPLSTAVLAGLTVFWALRLLVQWFVYDRRLWLGHRRRTAIHIALTVLWLYFTAVYAWTLLAQPQVPNA